jgi:hypothetical protein
MPAPMLADPPRKSNFILAGLVEQRTSQSMMSSAVEERSLNGSIEHCGRGGTENFV